MQLIKIVCCCCILIGSLTLQAQSTLKDSSDYTNKKLRKVEVDFLLGYYQQEGNNAAVTGGKGDEYLTDVTPSFIINIPLDKGNKENNLNIDLGVDVYTSASSDEIDPETISGASRMDGRVHVTAAFTQMNKSTNNGWGLNASFSNEYDYSSVGFGASFKKLSMDKNREFGISGNAYFDAWSLISPIELRGTNYDYGGSTRNSFNFSTYYAQVVNRRFQLILMADVNYQIGLLSTPFHRVYLTDTLVAKIEKLPDNKLKIPVGIRANYFVGDFMVLRSFYRYYTDDWGVTAHTASIEPSFKLSPFFSIYPSYRYHTQTAADYFAPFAEHDASAEYYTSDYDLSGFDSHFYGIGFRYKPLGGLFSFKAPKWDRNALDNGKIPIAFGKRNLESIDLKFGYYQRSNGLSAYTIATHLKF